MSFMLSVYSPSGCSDSHVMGVRIKTGFFFWFVLSDTHLYIGSSRVNWYITLLFGGVAFFLSKPLVVNGANASGLAATTTSQRVRHMICFNYNQPRLDPHAISVTFVVMMLGVYFVQLLFFAELVQNAFPAILFFS